MQVPDHLEDYIHRIGRTGRAGKARLRPPDRASREGAEVDLRSAGARLLRAAGLAARARDIMVYHRLSSGEGRLRLHLRPAR